jgi:hypothetical protein
VGEPLTFSQKIGLTRGKAIVVGVLAIALVAVVYRQYGGAADSDTISVEQAVAEPPVAIASQPLAVEQAAAEVPATNPQGAVTAAFDQSKWTPPELATVVAYDPFALPSTFPQPPAVTSEADVAAGGDTDAAGGGDDSATRLADAIEALQLELAALQERGVNVIVRGHNEYVAMIGDRTVHVVDEINGFTVTAIEPDGVRVEIKIQQ